MRTRYKSLAAEGQLAEDKLPPSHSEPSAVLPAERTLLPAYEAVFVRLSGLVTQLWKPTDAIASQVDALVVQHRLRERLSIGVHSQSIERPITVGSVSYELTGYGSRVTVRMGDKGAELHNAIKDAGGSVPRPSFRQDQECAANQAFCSHSAAATSSRKTGFHQGDYSAYIQAAALMLPLLRASVPHRESTLKPLLLVMSDSPQVAGKLDKMAHEFEIALLPAPSRSQAKGHDERLFNQLPWQDRVQEGEGFVR